MNKQKMILAAIGGVVGVAVLVMGCLVYGAYSSKVAALEGDDEEGVVGLEAVTGKARELSRKPIYPCAASVTAIESNITALTEWREATLRQAAQGDRFFDKTTAAAFKTMIVGDARRLKRLPGAVKGQILKDDFTFGWFNDYIGGGKMPEENALPTLQRQWDDLAAIVETLSKCGVDEVTTVALKAQEAAPEAQPAPGKKGKNAKKAKFQPKNAKAKAGDGKTTGPIVYNYVFSFNAKPVALAQVFNAFAQGDRFVVIEDFGFTRPQDAIVLSMGGDAKQKSETAATGSRRSRRRGGAAASEAQAKKEAAEKEDKKSGFVTDPEKDAPLAVTMQLAVYDFRSLEENTDEKAKGQDDGKAKKEVSK